MADLSGIFGSLNSGNRTYYNGTPLLLRNSRYATVVTKTGQSILAMPRQRFMFYATFTPGNGIPYGLRDFSSYTQGFAFQISKVDRPKFNLDVKTLNQYNRKRLVYTGIEYDNITITFHDTVDDRVLRVWRDYYQWFFGDGRSKGQGTTVPQAWNGPVITKDMPLNNGWGFCPPNTDPYKTNFFDTLDVYTFYGKKYTQMRMYNPKIVNIEFEQMDTESSALATATMTIRHEGVEFVNIAQLLDSEHISMFNLNAGDYYEPTDLFGGLNTFLLDINNSIQGTVDSMLSGLSSIPYVGQALAGASSRLVSAINITGIGKNTAQNLSASVLGKFGAF